MTATVDSIGGRIAGVDGQAPYVTALRASALFADPTYQRDVDEARVRKMAAAFDSRLLGVLEVSDRDDETYAILDGQHRWQAALRAHPDGDGAFLVCQVYTGLSVEDEARLFNRINTDRKALSWWDAWRSRRAGCEQKVLDIEEVLTRHQLRVHPAAEDGNIRAARALEAIVDDFGGLDMLDGVLVMLTSAFRRDPAALDATMLKGMALVLGVYASDELDADRLVSQLQERTPRQIRVQAAALRDVHRGQLSRLCAAVIVDLYNAGRGRNVEPFLARVPALAQRKGQRFARIHGTPRPAALEPAVQPVELEPAPRPTPGPVVRRHADGRPVEPDEAPAPAFTEPPAPVQMCLCRHARGRHAVDGVCSQELDCGCDGFQVAP